MTIILDIMIVDKKMDLNIYKERNGEDVSCCSSTTQAPTAAPETSSCCGSSKVAAPKEETQDEWKERIMKIDFNEWVSKYHLSFSA